jgi:hypothetical protein
MLHAEKEIDRRTLVEFRCFLRKLDTAVPLLIVPAEEASEM